MSKEIVALAKAKLGADLSDSLSGHSVQALLDELVQKRNRLTARRFEPGDEVSYNFGNDIAKGTVVSVNGNSTKLKSKPWENVNTSDITSTELEELTPLIAACNTLLVS